VARWSGFHLPPSIGRCEILPACSSALAYVPLAVAFTPSAWAAFGPFGLQLSRPLHYAVYFFAGAGLGACGIERGLLAPDGALVRHWRIWLVVAVGSLLLWMAFTARTMAGSGSPSFGLHILDDLSFVVACFSSCFAVLGLVMWFAARRLRVLDALKRDAYGIYLVHYAFVVWLQYALLAVALLAVIKGAIVFGGTLLLSWATVASIRRIPAAAQIIGADRRRAMVS
jgi:surface polysaccharide O-acyltransferase-like enzyme